MTLVLSGLDADCVIGDRPDEREREQRLTLNVTLDVSDRAATTDDLADTVDYAALAVRIRNVLREGRPHLIERAAHLVREVCLSTPGVRGARVCVRKADAIPGLAAAEAVL